MPKASRSIYYRVEHNDTVRKLDRHQGGIAVIIALVRTTVIEHYSTTNHLFGVHQVHQPIHQPALNSGEQPGTLYEGLAQIREIAERSETPRSPVIVSNNEEVPGSSPGRSTFRNT